jgi:D-glycero-D-manno-heptose 1,7-bisphosphate phosphatase
LFPALFLDRDGVINHNHGYVHKRENFDFMDNIFDLARAAHLYKYKIIVITNQAGIARGYYTEEQYHELSDWMCQQFSEASAPISKVYFSPYHPVAGLGKYLKDDFSRKPKPGMIIQAQKDLSLDLSCSILIGDKVSDIKAGTSAGVGANLLFAQERPNESDGCKYELIHTLLEAIPYLQRGVKSICK